jgi:sterol desaturase/sphingolipid hydroxylase (fatty acid hydroxylase superfamily)
MSFLASLSTAGLLIAGLIALSFVEAVIPLRARSAWSRRHLVPNLVLTGVTFATNLVFNIPLLAGLVWLQRHGLGLFNAISVPPPAAVLSAVVALDFAWYVTHVSMHHAPVLWRFHAVHHSDPAVDVTTTIRQHPGESVIRYGFLAAFAFAVGAPPAGFALYRVWSALHGLFEHANIRLPLWLDSAITLLFSSPNMHKIHHSRDAAFTDRNYTNIFSAWDRLFGAFVPARLGTQVAYGLDGYDSAGLQTTAGLLALPFRRPDAALRAGGQAAPELAQ